VARGGMCPTRSPFKYFDEKLAGLRGNTVICWIVMD
jgi:hypothetical protein